jgi:hypothetical protein
LSLWQNLYGNHAHLLVAKEQSEIFGYTIVAQHNYSGLKLAAILEICVWDRKMEAAKLLIRHAEFCGRKMNAVALVSWDTSEDALNETFLDSNFINAGRSIFSVGVTSSEFFKTLLESNPILQDSGAKVFSVDLSRKPFPSYSGQFSIMIGSDGVSVAEKNDASSFARIETDVVTLSEVLLGLRSAYSSYLSGEIKVKPTWKTLTVLRMFKKLSKKLKWNIPFGDFF